MTHTLIKCKQRRPKGSKISLFGKEYHFKPADDAKLDDPEAEHVCAIPNEDAKAIYRLLAIKEGYELADPAAELPAKPQPEAGQTIAADKQAEVKPDVIIKGGEGEEINLSQMEPEALRLFAKEQFNIKVHGKWSNDTVIGKIIEAMRSGEEE